MSPIAEFEEKEFERFFNDQMVVVDRQCWSPGQVLEGRIGFDSASMLNPNMFHYFDWIGRRRFHHMRRGVRVDRGIVEELFGELDRSMPPYRFNFFAQYKRPEFMFGYRSSEMDCWKGPYYRYEIDAKQNKILCRLEGVCGSSAFVSYCCPVYYTKEDLWEANRSGQILERTNYAAPHRLANNHAYSFVESGGRGKAHSENEDIESRSLSEILNSGRESNPPQSISKLVLAAGAQIQAVFE